MVKELVINIKDIMNGDILSLRKGSGVCKEWLR
jgi:hypothetical protein